MTENELFLSSVEDKIRRLEREYSPVHTGFLSMAERSAADALCKSRGVKCLFFGGFEDAERTVLFLLPDYSEEAIPPEDCPISLLRVRTVAGSKPLSHRDYLGAILALGIKREVVGDILPYENGADILVLSSMLPFLTLHFDKAGSVPLTVGEAPLSTLRVPEKRIEELRESVASLRLDCMVAAAFSLSREAAAEAIEGGRVFVCDRERCRTDFRVTEGEKIVLRGMGKVIFRKVCGTTRKGRLSVLFEKYI